MNTSDIQTLVSLPSASVSAFGDIVRRPRMDLHAASDPAGVQLSSGGGTAHLLYDAFNAASTAHWHDWLMESRKLLIHGSGESRRLPSYAAPGKPLTPLPIIPGFVAQRPDQMLLDLQAQTYSRLYWHAPESYRVMITCGDVLVVNDTWVPTYPEADVLIVGLPASIAEAQHHGVLICREQDGQLERFLQKPTEGEIRSIPDDQTYYLDTGIWLLSEKAITVLMEKCGWVSSAESFAGETPDKYDLYADYGLGLGTNPTRADEAVSSLTCAALPLNQGRFYHFGTSRALLESVHQLSRPGQRTFGDDAHQSGEAVSILHSQVDCVLTEENRLIWIENAMLPASWRLTHHHIITGIPANDWDLRLAPGICLDVTPIDEDLSCLRYYGFDDASRGAVSSAATLWMGAPAPEWFRKRGIALDDAEIDADTDIYDARLFPEGLPADRDAGFVQWLIDRSPESNDSYRQTWLKATRRSSRDLLSAAKVGVMAGRRQARMQAAPLSASDWFNQCRLADLQAVADLHNEGLMDPPEITGPPPPGQELACVHDNMYRAHVSGGSSGRAAAQHEEQAFSALRETLINQARLEPVEPERNVLDDQIVWARAPIRLDLAGGWTDTPPYCLEHGGRVVNVAADLNGQPPIQVFARVCETPHIVIRSIDLGLNETVSTFDALSDFGQLGGGFGIARAALCLAGFDPRFQVSPRYASLPEMLQKTMGGGIELSLLAAVPKGSGLGTSSILAATVLGALSELCRLGWDHNHLFARTLVLEQLLTSGGGWQDQVGGVVGGLKMIETDPGLSQRTVVRGLPREFFVEPFINRTMLLYYTGLTRVAHDILGDIVRSIFLNSNRHLGVIREIGFNASFAADAIQRRDYGDFCEAVNRSWRLNQRLDSGTNPPAVQQILHRVSDHLAACKLLGAGGGGYLLMLAKDAEAGARIQDLLRQDPPNARARFVNMNFSETGYQATRS